MNILPKKRWHVRTKDNIARVRRDEAAAAEEEKKKLQRIEIAEKERRVEKLRELAKEKYGTNNFISLEVSPKSKETENCFLSNNHINLFFELEQHNIINKPNEEYEKEKKLEKEKYEKQIGYLTYLGQDTNELTGTTSWYNKSRDEFRNEKSEVSKKQKEFEDPLGNIRKYLSCKGVKKFKNSNNKYESDRSSEKKIFSNDCNVRKKHKKLKKSKHKKSKKHKRKYSSHSSESDESSRQKVCQKPKVDLEKLRAERLKREQEERKKATELLARLNGLTPPTIKEETTEPTQKYNSQFNPHLAKQNFM